MRVLLTLSIMCALVVAPSASGVESTINPGVSIGKVKLGMTEAQVKKALGKWRYVNEQEGNRLNVSWGPFGSSWTVVFISGEVVQVSTMVPSQRTSSGIGHGSSWLALVRAYPNGVCRMNYKPAGPIAELLVPHKGGTQTIYYVPGPLGYPPTSKTGWHVAEVVVRTPWTPLPDFASEVPLECKSTWRTGDPH